MWIFKEQRKFSRSVNFEVLDVGLNRQAKFSALLNLDVLDVALQSARKVFKICELGGARCGFE